jgi:hypothetical protein
MASDFPMPSVAPVIRVYKAEMFFVYKGNHSPFNFSLKKINKGLLDIKEKTSTFASPFLGVV